MRAPALGRLATASALLLGAAGLSFGQTTNLLLYAEADAFLRAAMPTNNYGRAGSLSVAGLAATNGFGVPGGRSDSLVRFSLAESVPRLDEAFGDHTWFILNAVLRLYEMGSPNNASFSRGVGAFEIRWLAQGDVWVEGTGSPNVPTTDGVTFADLPSLLDPARDLALGVFTNRSADGFLDIPLPLYPAFVEDLRGGGPTTLHFTPASEAVGFTFLSRSDPRTSLRLTLELTIAPGPPPRISMINRTRAGEVAIRFHARSNWTHLLQGRDWVGPAANSAWIDLMTLAAAPASLEAQYSDGTTNAQRFYRLLAWP
jgi:hypothetical protein